jgi:hypothetical protein
MVARPKQTQTGETSMATQPRAVDPNAPPRQKRKRSPSVAKPAFFIIQILDENGEPMPFEKKRVRIVSVERSAEQVMDLVESGRHPNALYLRGIVPVARQSTPRGAPTPDTPHAA